jgi:hypothetical protein
LHGLRAVFRKEVRQLADETTVVQILDDGSSIRVTGASLLDQLYEAIATGSEKGKGGAFFGSKMPISVAAMDLWQEVCRFIGARTLEGCIHQLKAMAFWVDAMTDVDALAKEVAEVQSITLSIRSLLDPPRRLHVAAECPACHVRMVFRRDETGELVQVATLTLDGSNGCTCLNCGANWKPNQLEFLAGVLGCDPVQ